MHHLRIQFLGHLQTQLVCIHISFSIIAEDQVFIKIRGKQVEFVLLRCILLKHVYRCNLEVFFAHFLLRLLLPFLLRLTLIPIDFALLTLFETLIFFFLILVLLGILRRLSAVFVTFANQLETHKLLGQVLCFLFEIILRNVYVTYLFVASFFLQKSLQQLL